jgi:hypothetical protein
VAAGNHSTAPEAAENNSAPAFEDIARLAYSYWQARDGQNGSPEEDWLRAERELSAADKISEPENTASRHAVAS